MEQSEPTERIDLVLPDERYAEAVMAARETFVAEGVADGLAGLEDCASYDEWLDFEGRGRRAYGDGYVPATTWLAVREDGALVGFLDMRHDLNDFLRSFGGHVGYAVLPAYRRRGYAKQMLSVAKEKAAGMGMAKLLVTCHDGNVGSERAIVANGGQLENVVSDGTSRIKRFWIPLD